MSTFFPVNTPLINYYFYKAPFITNKFSLTNISVASGGTGYAQNDIIICAGGSYTSPVCLQVTGLGIGGTILSVSITNNGQYSVSPTIFTQLSTNGIGTGATFNNLQFTPNLQPQGPNVPLTGGFLFFYEDENRTVKANTYSDVSDPNNPVVNPNPIQLGTSGDYPLFYLDDRFYYIVITDNTGDQSNPVQVIEHYNPSEVLSTTSAFNDNFIVNPQFNYPIQFYRLTDDPGLVTKAQTFVAWSWEFIQDDKTDTKNYITFNNIAGQQIEGGPVFECVLDSETVSGGETRKDFRSKLGEVDFNQGNTLTFCAQMESKNGIAINVDIYIELYYGQNGSPSQFILLKTLNVGTTRKKYAFTFTMPEISGFSIGNGNYSALIVRPGIKQVCIFGWTNVMVVPGNQSLPVFVDEAEGFSKGQILGDSTNISDAGLYQNWSNYFYTNGKIFPFADTGTIVLAPTNLLQNFRAVCDGTSRFINGYTTNNIPNRRLYDAIGTQFGSAGDLIASSAKNVVTISSPSGARELTPYTAGTTNFTIAQTVKGLRLGFNLVSAGGNLVNGTFADNFAPLQAIGPFGATINPAFSNTGPNVMTYWGTQNLAINAGNMTILTTSAGSSTTKATFTINFNSNNPADYVTKRVAIAGVAQVSSFIDFPDVDHNVRQPSAFQVNASIVFEIDGAHDEPVGQYNVDGSLVQAITNAGPLGGTAVNFLSTLNIQSNIKRFITTIANPFSWTVTVNASPLAGQYFLYSSAGVNYYGWFRVNGAGTDPAISTRTGVAINIATGQSTTDIAAIIASTINSAQYSVPAPSDLPLLASGSKVSWFINL